MAGPSYVEVTRVGPVATVLMRRPDVHNAFDEHMIAQLGDAFARLRDEEGVRAVILAGEGRSFSAGADLDWMRRAAEFSAEENLRDATALTSMLRAVAECPRPVIARVQGGAFGGGAGLVAAVDIAVASDSARFGFTEVRLGLVPATIAPHVIEKIGRGHARRLFLTGERFGAAEALAIGLVHRVVAAEELDAAVDDIVSALIAGGPEAQRACKELVRKAAPNSTETDSYTADLIARVRSGAEAREGVSAFLEKRKPRWAEHDA
ncbi:MAG: enoyl-CoA hydratase/isomerase family protein [Chloroflexi bacterium]|nr:enoyl-CoA hydratase/isomerase family protein [Chloroflexota bacterium]